jgi:hypothetical protein
METKGKHLSELSCKPPSGDLSHSRLQGDWIAVISPSRAMPTLLWPLWPHVRHKVSCNYMEGGRAANRAGQGCIANLGGGCQCSRPAVRCQTDNLATCVTLAYNVRFLSRCQCCFCCFGWTLRDAASKPYPLNPKPIPPCIYAAVPNCRGAITIAVGYHNSAGCCKCWVLQLLQTQPLLSANTALQHQTPPPPATRQRRPHLNQQMQHVSEIRDAAVIINNHF